MGNSYCLCSKSQNQIPPSLKNSRILEESLCDQISIPNSNRSNTNSNPNKISLKSKNMAKLRLKYGTRNCIEEEETSSFYESVYSEMVNNSIFHLPSLISSGAHNNPLDLKNSPTIRSANPSLVKANSASALVNANTSSQKPKGNHYQSAVIGAQAKQFSRSQISTKTAKQPLEEQISKNNRQQMILDIFISNLALSNPEGDRIKLGQKVVLRHLNSESNLHSHYRKYEKGSKSQEVSACQSKTIHQHDFWIIDTTQNYYERLNQTNRVWAQIGQYQKTQDTNIGHSIDQLNNDDFEQRTHSSSRSERMESQIMKSPYILNENNIILKHCATQKELASSSMFINASKETQQVFCDELSHNFQIKESFNWKIIINNQDGFLRDNSIIQIVHSETNKPLRTNKHNGILKQTIEVACGNKEQSINRSINNFWIINVVQSDSNIAFQESQ